MTGVNALPVKVPFPRHEPSALFAELPSQHRVTKIRKYLVGIFKANSFQRRRAFKDPHILLDLSSRLYYRPKLPIYFRPCDICRSEPDDAISVNRAERFLVPTDVEQTVFQQPCVQLLVQELLFYLSQISFCGAFSSLISNLQSAAPFERKKALDLVRENQQSSAHNFAKDFSSIFPKISRRCPLKKGAATENPLEYGKTEVQILFEPLLTAISSMELPKNFENKKLPNTLR